MRRPILLLSLLLTVMLGGLAATRPLVHAPPLRDQTAPGQFDAARAKGRLAVILGDERPHPADSAASDAVRARLIGQIRSLGLTPIVRDQFACNQIYKRRGVTCARVRNVIVALGPSSGKAVLLNTHYDSSVAGPGAGDAGAGVATLLEVASILKNERLQRPLILLFNEGEELGLVGARAFLADPLSRRVDSLVNLEARGTTGPVSMFETSLPNGPPVRAFAKSVDRPVANSLATDFYRQLPNYTDVNSFSERGWTTLNFAMIGNETRYHSAGDNLAALDLRSVQHMGDQALAVTREFAAGIPQGDGSLLFADIAGRQLLVIPEWAGVELLALLAFTFAFAAYRRGGLWRGLAVVAAGLVLSAGLAWLGVALTGLGRSGSFWRAFPFWTHLAAYACGIAGAVVVVATIGRRLSAEQLRASFWLGFLMIGLAVLFVAPGGIIYFLFPPLVAFVGISAARQARWVEPAAAIAAATLLWLTLGEMLALLGDLMVDGPFFIFAPLAMLVAMPWLIEAKGAIDSSGRLAAIGISSLLMLIGWSAVAAAPAYSADRQQRFTIQHVTDATAGKSQWLVLNDGAALPDAFGGIEGWSRDEVVGLKRKGWVAPAPDIAGIEPPQVQVVARDSSRGGRTVRFRIDPNGAESVTLMAPEDATLIAAGSGAFVQPFAEHSKGDYSLTCFGRSCSGATMQFTTASSRPVTFTVVGTRRALPDAAKPLIGDRPSNARPQYSPDSTMVVSRVPL